MIVLNPISHDILEQGGAPTWDTSVGIQFLIVGIGVERRMLIATWNNASHINVVFYEVFIQEGTSVGLFDSANSLVKTLSLEYKIFFLPNGSVLDATKTYHVGVRAVNVNNVSELNIISLSAQPLASLDCIALLPIDIEFVSSSVITPLIKDGVIIEAFRGDKFTLEATLKNQNIPVDIFGFVNLIWSITDNIEDRINKLASGTGTIIDDGSPDFVGRVDIPIDLSGISDLAINRRLDAIIEFALIDGSGDQVTIGHFQFIIKQDFD